MKGVARRARAVSICLFSYLLSRFIILFKLSLCPIEYPVFGTSPISGDMILIRVEFILRVMEKSRTCSSAPNFSFCTIFRSIFSKETGQDV